MRWTLPAPIFWLGYFALMLILLLLGETFLNLYVMLVITLFVHFGLRGRQQVPSHPWYRLSVGLSFLFFLWLIITTAFSISIPLSLNLIWEWVFLINLFFWFLEVPWNDVDRRFWLLGMLMMGSVLSLLGLVALALPNYNYLIPGMNLIYPTYGHNHLGVVLLLVMPMFWAASREWPSKTTQLLAIIFSFTPLITFGRTVIMLSAVQLAVVHHQVAQKHWLGKWLVKIAIGATVVMVASQFFLGWYFDQTKVCPIPQFRNQICKSWEEERRILYLQQAWWSFVERPWTGSGPGTFGLISEKFRQLPSYSSGFVHNDYVQFFVEYGLAGGLMLCLGLGWLLYKLRPVAFHTKNDRLYTGIYWGLVFVAVNSLVDFDFNFLGVLALELMGLALLSKWTKVDPWPKRLTLFEAIVRWWKKWFHSAALGILALVTVLYMSTNLMLDLGKTEWVAMRYPYISWQSKILFDRLDQLSPEAQQKLRTIYWHHSTLLNGSTELAAANAIEASRFEHLFTIDPWSRLRKETYSYYLNAGDFKRAEQEIGRANFFFQKRLDHGYGEENIPDPVKDSLSRALMWLADRQFAQGRFGEGTESMYDAHIYDQWVFNTSPYCNSLPKSYYNSGEDPVAFSQPLLKIPKQFFGQCRPDFAEFYIKLYGDQLATGECVERCHFYFQQALGYEDWATNRFWERLWPLHLTQLQKSIAIQDVEWSIRQWREIIAVLKTMHEHPYADSNGEFRRGDDEKRMLLQIQQQIDPLLAGLGQEAEMSLRQELRNDARWLYTTLK